MAGGEVPLFLFFFFIGYGVRPLCYMEFLFLCAGVLFIACLPFMLYMILFLWVGFDIAPLLLYKRILGGAGMRGFVCPLCICDYFCETGLDIVPIYYI